MTISNTKIGITNPTFLIAIGSNQPWQDLGAAELVQEAIRRLGDIATRVRPSALYATPCFPAGAGPDYVNAAVWIEAQIRPEDMLQRLHAIEQDLGRMRAGRWGMRTIDLDLIACGDRVLPDRDVWAHWRGLTPEDQQRCAPDRLILPHPRMQERAFVLVPLADVAPGWRHPVIGATVAQMLAALPATDRAEVRMLPQP
ncbi:2-amino-4-hydroxy-6-hydroxymethyldihydropteridine diphosphokinase [Plastorhodobacter daqingensis]|uniref:2-amino-4-hydroxy-6-hydroxymethyldihydropteridine pyrophosphokinase n=1 Tax=Plastorhodobacter daqingensis TaxID=1387281 RepID=A0ABW2UHV8_9RHOB